MKQFTVGSKITNKNDINIGIAPGKFDTKQLILSSIAVLTYAPNNIIRFVRTLDKEELSKCTLFINDDFTSLFPVIPSYHDVEEQWEKNSKIILDYYDIYGDMHCEYITKSVKEKICNLEAIDCLMDLYFNTSALTDSFESALEVTLKLIKKEIKDSIDEVKYFHTISVYVENSTSNYVILPIYVQGWRNVINDIGKNIDYAILPDEDGTFVIESYDKGVIMKKHVKNMRGISYSGRYFVKVKDIKAAESIVSKLPKSNKKSINCA